MPRCCSWVMEPTPPPPHPSPSFLGQSQRSRVGAGLSCILMQHKSPPPPCSTHGRRLIHVTLARCSQLTEELVQSPRAWGRECVTWWGVCCSFTNLRHHRGKVLQCYRRQRVRSPFNVRDGDDANKIQHLLILLPYISFFTLGVCVCRHVTAEQWYCSVAQPGTTPR